MISSARPCCLSQFRSSMVFFVPGSRMMSAPARSEARAVADEIEPLIGEDYKPFPCYEDLLFRL